MTLSSIILFSFEFEFWKNFEFLSKLILGLFKFPLIKVVKYISLFWDKFKIISIKDTSPVPHNGCRPPEKRRV